LFCSQRIAADTPKSFEITDLTNVGTCTLESRVTNLQITAAKEALRDEPAPEIRATEKVKMIILSRQKRQQRK
jgi:hypothetical protein